MKTFWHFLETLHTPDYPYLWDVIKDLPNEDMVKLVAHCYEDAIEAAKKGVSNQSLNYYLRQAENDNIYFQNHYGGDPADMVNYARTTINHCAMVWGYSQPEIEDNVIFLNNELYYQKLHEYYSYALALQTTNKDYKPIPMLKNFLTQGEAKSVKDLAALYDDPPGPLNINTAEDLAVIFDYLEETPHPLTKRVGDKVMLNYSKYLVSGVHNMDLAQQIFDNPTLKAQVISRIRELYSF